MPQAADRSRCWGTPYMIALMENATCAAVEPYLEEGETTVGTRIDVTHDRASKTGETITAPCRDP